MESTVQTFQDAVDHLRDSYEMDSTDRLIRNIKRAILTAYRDIPNYSKWNYYVRRRLFTTEASYSTGTITYDHTGGTYERELTLASGTWPSNASTYRVIISDVHYDIDERKSNSVVTLSPNNNPGADVAAGTTYNSYRSEYPLPVDFRKICHLYDLDNEHEIRPVGNDVQHAESIYYYDTPQTPWNYSIRNTGEYVGGLSIVFSPPPDSARSYDFLYEAAPRPLKIYKYSTGTVATTGTALTVTGGTLPLDCEGSVIRFSADTTEPTSVIGSLISGTATDNPFTSQRIIVSRDSGTTATLDTALDSDVSGVAYTISDPIDMEWGAMYTAFLRWAEAELERLENMETRREAEEKAIQSLKLARESDQRFSSGSYNGVYYDKFSRIQPTTDA